MTDKIALHITKEAKNNSFVDCDIHGAKIDGQGTFMLRTRIHNFRESHPSLWIGIVYAIVATVIAGIILLVLEYELFVPQ